VTSNTCGAGDPVGTVVPYTYTLQEIGSNKGFINDGEVLRVIDQKGLILGMVTLHWPTITVSFVNEFQGFATLTMSFSSPDTGAGDLSILYSGCSIRYEDR
jgi:hypothetical protein